MDKINFSVRSSRLAFILAASFLVCGGVRAQDKDFSKGEIKVTKVSGNI
jgi:hypothetical protein